MEGEKLQSFEEFQSDCEKIAFAEVEIGFEVWERVLRHKKTKQTFPIRNDSNTPRAIYYVEDFFKLAQSYGEKKLKDTLKELEKAQEKLAETQKQIDVFQQKLEEPEKEPPVPTPRSLCNSLYKNYHMKYSADLKMGGTRVNIGFINPAKLYQIYVYTDEDRAKLVDLSKLIFNIIDSDRANTLQCPPKKGDIVITCYRNNDYRRAKVVTAWEDSVIVYFMDHGHEKRYTYSELYPAPIEIIETPVYGIGVNLKLEKSQLEEMRGKRPNRHELFKFLKDKEIIAYVFTPPFEKDLCPWYYHYKMGDIIVQNLSSEPTYRKKLNEIIQDFYDTPKKA